MPNKRGRPHSGKPRKKAIKFDIYLDSAEQKEQLKELGGSAWVRGKLQEEKMKEKPGRKTEWPNELGRSTQRPKMFTHVYQEPKEKEMFYKHNLKLQEEKEKRDEL